ncbi:MAG: type I restriction enzyme HsdR N-terminal domain-containing protein [Bacteriovoracaceae bacterium]|nr:type I restriction enzyme HsdR N-terminal domain-containing protein [Bacteriovoracaceae bacterium]
MSKETKQDRLARQMTDQMTEHLIELKAFESDNNCKESAVEKWAETFLKNCLGYSVSNGYSIKSQDKKGKLRPDLVIFKGEKPIFVIEVKKLGFDFDKSDFRNGKIQLKEYLSAYEEVSYGFLCNGYDWKLYDFSNKQNPIEIQKVSFKPDGALIENSKKMVEELCYEFTSFHESAHSNEEWADYAKEATAFSPDSLAKAILSSSVMKFITKEIRGEHEYKASTELLYDKVYNLLSYGLDDTMKEAFNPEKDAEFKKYIKSQIKQLSKTKKTAKSQQEPATAEATSTEQKVQPQQTEETKNVA